MKNRTVLIALMLVAAGSDLVGCAFHQVPIESPDVPPTMFEPLDVTVGVYFSPEFESFAHEQKGPRQPIWIHFKLGPPSRELFKQLFEATFRETVLVNSRVAMSDGGAALDAMIEPKITRFVARLTEHVCFLCLSWTVLVSLTYEVVLSSPDGARLGTWSGTFNDEKTTYGNFTNLAGQIIDEMMRETAAKFLAEFPENDDVAGWLKSTADSRRAEGID